MFLIQYAEKSFVDGEDIRHVHFGENGEIMFKLKGEPKESYYMVEKERACRFVDNLQGLNSNCSVTDIEGAYYSCLSGVKV